MNKKMIVLRTGDVAIIGDENGFNYEAIADLCRNDKISLSCDENILLVQEAFVNLFDSCREQFPVMHDHVDEAYVESEPPKSGFSALMEDLLLEQSEGHYGN